MERAGRSEPTSMAERQEIREKVLAELAPFARPDTRYARNFHEFIPAFEGYEVISDTLASLPFWPGRGPVYVTPDNCLDLTRARLIGEGRPLLQTISVRLGFRYFAPGSVDRGLARLAATLDGADLLSRSIDLEGVRALGPLDLVLTGCRAVTRQGVRFGKGHGYFDIEWGILSQLGVVSSDTPVVVVCHDTQVVGLDLVPSAVDTVVDWIVTPTEVVEVERTIPKPVGIQWERLRAEQWESTPALGELQALIG